MPGLQNSLLTRAGDALDDKLVKVATKVLADIQSVDHLEELALASAEEFHDFHTTVGGPTVANFAMMAATIALCQRSRPWQHQHFR